MRLLDLQSQASGVVGYLLAALLAMLLFGAALPARGTATEETTTALACPRGETTILRGKAQPGTALIVHFDGRPVGGASVSSNGSWIAPLQVAEPSGIYPVVVTRRQDGSLVSSFTCYVDLPIGATPTATPTARAISSLPSTTATAEVPYDAPPAHEASPPTTTGTPSAEFPEATPSPPSELPTTTTSEEAPATTTTPIAERSSIVIVAVQSQNPVETELFEYVLLQNAQASDQTLAAWNLSHAGSGERYAIPALTLPPGGYLMVWSGSGLDDPASGNLYWPATRGRWAPGDDVELHDAGGQVVSRLQVELPLERP